MTAEQDRASREHRELEQRVDTLLGEFRIMVPALAALLGFQLIAAMQQTYGSLPPFHRAVNFAGVACTMAALGFMLVPSAYHRFAPRLHEDEAFVSFSQRSLSRGFVFFALSLTLSLYLQAARSFSADAASALAAAAALAFFGVVWWAHPWRLVKRTVRESGEGETMRDARRARGRPGAP
jgi:hypothetical protein